MKKISVIFLILFLIFFTAIVKNSTKRISDEIFTKKENIRDLKKDYEKIKLEYEYLSSAEKLLEYNELYFDNQLIKKKIQEIKVVNQSLEKLKIKDLVNE